MSPEHQDGCGAYLKILGLPVYGEDLRSALPVFQPSLALARAWNGDLREQIAAALEQLHSDLTEAEKQLTVRAISAKVVRSFYMVLAAEIQVWTTAFGQQSAYVLDYFPEQADVLGYLAEARAGEKPLAEFTMVLTAFVAVALPLFEARLAAETV
jgi:hypothetical protein